MRKIKVEKSKNKSIKIYGNCSEVEAFHRLSSVGIMIHRLRAKIILTEKSNLKGQETELCHRIKSSIYFHDILKSFQHYFSS